MIAPLGDDEPLMRTLAAAAFFLASFSLSIAGRAEPQGNAGLTLGVAGVGSSGAFYDHAEFHLGARGDVMFGRSRNNDFGIGPYAEVGTFAFNQFQFGGGATVLLPIHETLPIVASIGAFGRHDDTFGAEAGVSGALFWGTRSYNFHANYVMAAGLLVNYRVAFGDSKESMLLIGTQFDAAVIALPFAMLLNLIRGPTDDARRVD